MLDNEGNKMRDPLYRFFDDGDILVDLATLKRDKRRVITEEKTKVKLSLKAERVYDVKVFTPDGDLKEIIPGEELKKKKPQYFEF